MNRATELDSSWAKGYSRLAEVYNAQAQFEKAVEAYERAMSLSSEPERTRYKRLCAKMQEKTLDVFYINGAIYDPARNGNDAMFARFDEAVPDRSKFGMDDQHLTPLGYMTAANKLYSGYTRITDVANMIQMDWLGLSMATSPFQRIFRHDIHPRRLCSSHDQCAHSRSTWILPPQHKGGTVAYCNRR